MQSQMLVRGSQTEFDNLANLIASSEAEASRQQVIGPRRSVLSDPYDDELPRWHGLLECAYAHGSRASSHGGGYSVEKCAYSR